MSKTAILLHNLGGPSAEEEVQPFLEQLFSDPEIFKIPLGSLLQKPFARFVSKRRAPSSAQKYREMGGFPLLEWTRAQAEGLKLGLAEYFPDEEFLVLPAMRYWHPFVRESLEEARRFGATRILSFTMYPQYSTTTTGSSERQMERDLAAMDWQPELVRVSRWSEEEAFLDCHAWRVRRALDRLDPAARDGLLLLYSAHGTPMSYVRKGDPYVKEIEATVRNIEARVDREVESKLVFQSKVGPIAWTQPYLDDTILDFGKGGGRSLLICPVAFVSDHLETLHEIDIEGRELAQSVGIRHFARTEALNAAPDFLGCLTQIAKRALQ